MNEVVIGIDFGKNIGLAYSLGSMAVPYCTVQSVKDAAAKIIEKRATMLVVGWPLMLDGSEGEQCVLTRKMLDELLGQCNLPYKLQDERFSSKFSKCTSAYRTPRFSSSFVGKGGYSNGPDDHAHSAAWILQNYLG